MTAGRRSEAEPRPFPWDEVLRFALGVLRWSPADTWAATPREIAAALTRPGAVAPMSRDDLARLLAAFPDEGEAHPPSSA